jgi:hypothetical protein
VPGKSLYEMLSGGYTAKQHREKMKFQPKPELNIHKTLDLIGMADIAPPLSVGADLLNSGLYAAKGDYSNAKLSAAAAAPMLGIGAALKKLIRPSNQLRAATGYVDSYEGWFKNLNDYSIQNPGQVDFKKVTKDIQDNPFNSSSKEFYQWMKDYSREHFGDFVTVPRASVAGSKKKKGKFARKPEKDQKVVSSPTRKKQEEEYSKELKDKKGAFFTKTKRSEY